MNKNNYVDLRVTGRLFPSWILLNFKKYKLEDALNISDEDPCKQKQVKLGLRKFQEFVSTYLDYRSPYKEILLYHGLGSGKTATAINIYNILYNYTPDWNIYIIIKASIKGNWMDEINKWLQRDEYSTRFNNIKFINYDSPFADRDFLDAVKKSDSSKKSILMP